MACCDSFVSYVADICVSFMLLCNYCGVMSGFNWLLLLVRRKKVFCTGRPHYSHGPTCRNHERSRRGHWCGCHGHSDSGCEMARSHRVSNVSCSCLLLRVVMCLVTKSFMAMSSGYDSCYSSIITVSLWLLKHLQEQL